MIKPVEPVYRTYTNYSNPKTREYITCKHCLHKCHCGVECIEYVNLGLSDKVDSCGCGKCEHKEKLVC